MEKLNLILIEHSVSGPGALRIPNIPDQFKTFKGPCTHSAVWDKSIDLNNKIVGVIGSGTSAVQIIPSIAPVVKELHVFQRRSAWVLPRQQFAVPTYVKTLFSYIPFLMTMFRTFLYLSAEFRYYAFKANSFFGKAGNKFYEIFYCVNFINQTIFFSATKGSLKLLKAQIPDDIELRKALTPQFKFGCKRMLLTNEYYPALNQSKSTVHTSKITKVNDHSITMENGVTQKLDVSLSYKNVAFRSNTISTWYIPQVLILATGFLVQDFFAPMEITGKDSVNILQKWKQSEPRLYYGVVSSQTPNHFTLLGPNTVSESRSL